jgi:hypothetical protein
MKLGVLENIYGQYVYIFSVLSCTVDGKGKISIGGIKKIFSGAANLRNSSGEFHCTLAMILD